MLNDEESFQSKVNGTYANTILKYSNYIAGVTQTNILDKNDVIEKNSKDTQKDVEEK